MLRRAGDLRSLGCRACRCYRARTGFAFLRLFRGRMAKLRVLLTGCARVSIALLVTEIRVARAAARRRGGGWTTAFGWMPIFVALVRCPGCRATESRVLPAGCTGLRVALVVTEGGVPGPGRHVPLRGLLRLRLLLFLALQIPVLSRCLIRGRSTKLRIRRAGLWHSTLRVPEGLERSAFARRRKSPRKALGRRLDRCRAENASHPQIGCPGHAAERADDFPPLRDERTFDQGLRRHGDCDWSAGSDTKNERAPGRRHLAFQQSVSPRQRSMARCALANVRLAES